MNINEKTIIITGGAQGIGKCTALRLLNAGMNVVVADIDREAGAELVTAHHETGRLKFIPTDVTDQADIETCVLQTAGLFGGIDAVVNNAGIIIRKNIENLTLDDWYQVMDTNVTSCFLMARFASPYLKKSRGSIINIASTRALQSEADTESYAASKGAILALTHALAVSFSGTVRVNCVSPGWIDVSAWQKQSRVSHENLRPVDHSQHPAGRVGRPEDIASMVQYLLSDEAGFVTGQNFIIDGGMTKKMIYEE